jgi:hypothetical protein
MTLSRLAIWLNRIVLLAAGLLLGIVGRKFIVDPVGSAGASGILLGSAVAITNMRASFGAFPLACSIIAFSCLIPTRRQLVGLSLIATVIGVAFATRVYGILIDGTLAPSLRVLFAEGALFSLAVLAILMELRRRRGQKFSRVARSDRDR